MSNEEPSYWERLHNQAVLIQLAKPYVLVTHPNQPTLQYAKDENGQPQVVGAISLPYLRGLLRVFPTPEGPMLELETHDPDPDKHAKVFITLHPGIVDFISRTEASLITT